MGQYDIFCRFMREGWCQSISGANKRTIGQPKVNWSIINSWIDWLINELIKRRIFWALTPSTAMKFRPKFFWKWSFVDQNQQPLKSVEPFERILRALFISQCPHKFSSFLDVRNTSNRFRLFSHDFRLFGFFFPGSACSSTLASPRNLPSWVKYYEKLEVLEKNCGGPNS